MAHDHGPGRWMAALALVCLAMPAWGQSSDPAVKAQQELQKCQDVFLRCANASCKAAGPACADCEKARARCRADVNSNLRGKDPSKPPEQPSKPWWGNFVLPQWACVLGPFTGLKCTPDDNPCTFDTCQGGECKHQMPSLTATLTSSGKITSEPRMPEMVGHASLSGVEPDPTSTAQFKWTFSIAYTAPNGYKINQNYDPSVGGSDHSRTLSPIRGGELTARVTYTRNGADCGSVDFKQTIVGANPAFVEVQAALSGEDPILRQVACHESAGKLQFDSGKPVTFIEEKSKEKPKRMGVGLMQITNPRPSDDAYWNWRTNLKEGLAIFKTGIKDADTYYDKMRKLGARPLTEEEQNQNRITRYNGGRYWYYENGDWVRHPFLQPYLACQGLAEGTVVYVGKRHTRAVCTPYYDLVIANKGCK